MTNKYYLNTKKKRILFSLICLLVIIFSILIYNFLNKQYNFFIPCLFHEITGLYCPGCGITRAFIALSRLHFYEAFQYNSLVISLLPFFTLYYLDILISWINMRKTIFAHKIPNYLWYILIVIIIIFGILRNIPYFDFLAPIGN